MIGIEDHLVAFGHAGAQSRYAAEHGHPHRTRHDHDMRGERTFLQHHALEPAPVIFEQFRRPQIACEQHRVAPQTLRRRRAQLSRDDPQQPVRQILEIVHAIGQQRIVDLAHAHPRTLLHPFDRRLGRQPAVDRLVDAPAPTLVIGEHLVGFEHLDMFAALAEFGLARQRIDLVAHLVEGAVHTLAFRLDIFRHDLVDLDPRLVKHRLPRREPFDQRQSFEDVVFDMRYLEVDHAFAVDQFLVRDQFRQHHCGGLQRFDLDIFVPPRIDMLDAQDTDRPFAVDDRDAGKGMELFLARFGAVGEIGMRLGLGQIERLDIVRDRAGKPLAHGQPRHVHRFGIEALRRIKLQRTFAQQVDRADLARQAFGDDLDHPVELVLRMRAPGHHLVQAGKDLAGGGCSCHGCSL